MVQTEMASLTAECTEWRQILRNYRDTFRYDRRALQDICSKATDELSMLDVEHFENQFHIQLINIHDLKQEIKRHEGSMILSQAHAGLTEGDYSRHERLLQKFLALEARLQAVRDEFSEFIDSTN